MYSFSVTKNGKELDSSLYTWDEETKTFSTKESNLVLNFNNLNEVTFNTGLRCIFNTGSYCTFNTGSECTFDTGSDCTFDTGLDCTFNTGSDCTFDTGLDCTFNTESDCTFNTESDCTFNTGSDCTFNTGSDCTFNTGSKCVIVRKDVFEVITLKEGKKIKLNGWKEKGYTEVKDTKTISIDGKDIEISLESYKAFKEQFKI